jgi:Tannase and feruloyl esterase
MRGVVCVSSLLFAGSAALAAGPSDVRACPDLLTAKHNSWYVESAQRQEAGFMPPETAADYHGWSDATIPPQPSMASVAAIASRLGPDRVDSFVRLFLVPGLGHCTNRDHSQQFGQYGETPARGDPERDILAALERWVESGIAPEHPGVPPVSAALEKNSRQGC